MVYLLIGQSCYYDEHVLLVADSEKVAREWIDIFKRALDSQPDLYVDLGFDHETIAFRIEEHQVFVKAAPFVEYGATS